jgi:splicing factor 3B subunit 2
MGLSRAEKNRRKRERKKRQKAEERNQQLHAATTETDQEADVEIEYVAELPISLTNSSGGEDDGVDNNISEMIRRFHERSTALVSEDEGKKGEDNLSGETDTNHEEDDDGDEVVLSKKKLRKMKRPTIAELKNRVERADLVEAHDVTSADPEFLLYLKALPGTVPVPRHWGRKRKYLQGKVSSIYIS